MNEPRQYRCEDCDWGVDERDEPGRDLPRLAIEHHAETGHRITSDRIRS
ncbi:hypothetical protein [Halegenticoccus soli]|nr:hypothetical protein [Halegenticoccus soli]